MTVQTTTDFRTKPAPSAAGQLSAVLAALHCPYCGSDLAHEPAAGAGYGVLRCSCHSYPIVDGIPILQQVDRLHTVVNYIRRSEPQRALLQALNLFRVKWARRSRWHQFRYRLNCRKLLSGDDLTFQDAVELVRKPQEFADYLLHRYANPSFLAASGVLQLLGSVVEGADGSTHRPPRALDLACGAGHSSFLMRYLFPQLSVISADHDFVSLFLAKRFVAPDAVHLCVDAEVPSPFAGAHFDAVFCLDAFHYLKAKRTVVRELARVSTPDALWLFPHLHNALQKNITAGIPMSPEGYLECFDLPDARLYDETEVLQNLSRRHTLDLSASPSVAQLNRAPTLLFVAGGNDHLRRVHEQFPALLYRDCSRLTINPIYRRTDSGDSIELTMNWPNPVMKEECVGAEAVLPRQYRLDKQVLRRGLDSKVQPGDPQLAELVGRFLLVPLPPCYVRGQHWIN